MGTGEDLSSNSNMISHVNPHDYSTESYDKHACKLTGTERYVSSVEKPLLFFLQCQKKVNALK
jgi:hypothetical protein